MKERIKGFLISALIVFTMFVVVGSIVKLINYPKTIELYDNNENIEKYNELKDEANLILGDDSCHVAINDLIKFYGETSYNGKVELNRAFFLEDATTPLSLGVNLVKNCENYRERFNEKNITNKILTSAMLYEEMFYKPYWFKYEISIDDIFGRINYESNIINVEYTAERKMELDLINSLLEVMKEDQIYEE